MTNNEAELRVDEILRNRVKLVGDGEWTLVGTPQDVITELAALITEQTRKAVEEARSKDPHKCDYGHVVYSHNTADGWCCACEADVAFLEAEIAHHKAEE